MPFSVLSEVDDQDDLVDDAVGDERDGCDSVSSDRSSVVSGILCFNASSRDC